MAPKKQAQTTKQPPSRWQATQPDTHSDELQAQHASQAGTPQRSTLPALLLGPHDVLHLQRTLGNRAVYRLIGGGAEAHQPGTSARGIAQRQTIQRFKTESYKELLKIKQRSEHEFIRKLFGSSFSTGVWKIPKQSGGDGIMGRNCISAAYKIDVAGANKQVALHINFMVSCGSFTEPVDQNEHSALTINLSLLHITARSADNQVNIEENGPSILTAARSIHCGPNNDWDWTDAGNVLELRNEIGAALVDLQTALNPFGQAYVAGLRDSLRNEMTRACRNREVTLTILGDATWR